MYRLTIKGGVVPHYSIGVAEDHDIDVNHRVRKTELRMCDIDGLESSGRFERDRARYCISMLQITRIRARFETVSEQSGVPSRRDLHSKRSDGKCFKKHNSRHLPQRAGSADSVL